MVFMICAVVHRVIMIKSSRRLEHLKRREEGTLLNNVYREIFMEEG